MDTQTIIKLRKQTGAGMVDCQKALKEANDDFKQAVQILRKKGEATAAKRAERDAGEGIVYAYIHSNNKIGAMIELRAETDFVARNEDFKQLAHDIAMQIAAQAAEYLVPEDVPEDVIAKEKEIYVEQLKKEGKPEDVIEKIIPGKLDKFYSDVCLLKQPFVKDDSVTIEELINEKIGSIGEKIELKRFCRFEI